MQQRTLITDPEHIRSLTKEISFFSCRKQMFKVQIDALSDKDNYELERSVVKYYSLGQHSLLGALPSVTILVYLFFVLSGMIPYFNLGIVATILLYIPFAAGVIAVCRVLVTLYAKRGLGRMADELETYHGFSIA